jgi:hypothetical protein
MKVVLDLDQLRADGEITQAEYDKLSRYAAHATGSLGINILVGFGVVAVAAGAVALVPNAITGMIVGAAVFAAGLWLLRVPSWDLLARICVVVGALMAAMGLIALGEGSLESLIAVTIALAVGGVIAKSGLLIAASVLALGSVIGARTGYSHAAYSLAIYEPLITIVVFSALAYGTFIWSKRLPEAYAQLAIMAARTSVLMVNFGFWVGSLWGDRLWLLRGDVASPEAVARAPVIPEWAFGIGWAAALAAVGYWGVKANRRWVVNVCAVFAAIHFYTQWFDKLGPNPFAFFLGGLLMLAFALALWRFNKTHLEGKPA